MPRLIHILIALSVLIFSSSIHASEMEKLNNGIATLADKIIKQMQLRHVKLIAMGDFDNSNGKTQFERNVEIGLVNSIVTKNLPDISIIERKNLSEVLKEQKLGNTGLLAKKTRAKLGEILGVEAIVTAMTTVLKREVTVNVRMYAITTGRILAAPSYTFSRNETIDELLEQPAREASRPGVRITSRHRKVTTRRVRQPEGSACFANKFIQGCSKVSRSKDKKRVAITATLINHSDVDLYLGQITICRHSNDGSCQPKYSDTHGGSRIKCRLVADGKNYLAERTNGLPTFFRRWIDQNKVSLDNFVLLSPGANLSVNYGFASEEEIEGDSVDFSSNAVMYYESGKDGKFKKLKFTISGTDLVIPSASQKR
jgi:hypothetical protein